jgi:hypothetical protein
MSPYVIRHGRRIEVETLDTGVAAKPKRQAKGEPFVVVPLRWARLAVKDGGLMEFFICADLLHRAWKAKGKSFVMPNTKCVSPKVKYRVLRALAAAKLITVEWRHGKSPLITMFPAM